jgi:hypothetical protein
MKSQDQSMQHKDSRTCDELHFLAKLASLITELTSRFLTLDAKSLDKEMDRSLREIGEFAAADRSHVFQFSDGGARVSNTHE